MLRALNVPDDVVLVSRHPPSSPALDIADEPLQMPCQLRIGPISLATWLPRKPWLWERRPGAVGVDQNVAARAGLVGYCRGLGCPNGPEQLPQSIEHQLSFG